VRDDVIGTVLGEYRIEARIGRGGMATVYKAYQPSLDRFVAIKVLVATHDQQALERFRHEARAVAQLDHPHILPVHDSGEHDSLLYLVMPLVEGGMLAGRTGRPRLLGWSIEVCSQVADALDHAHTRGVVHRDVNPSNILLGTDDWVWLADFGIARMLDGDRRIPQRGIGTAAYMSPEQCQGEPGDARADQYALAITFYELLAGRVPYRAATPMDTMSLHINGALPRLRDHNPEVPPAVDEVLRRALAKRPADRYTTVTSFVAELRQAAESYASAHATASFAALPASPPRRRPRRPLRWRGVGAIAAAAALLTLAGAGLLRTGETVSPPMSEAAITSAVEAEPGDAPDPTPLVVHAACLEPMTTIADADAALAAGALVAAERSFRALAGCADVDEVLISRRIAGTDVLLMARSELLTGDGEAAIARLRTLAAADPTLPGLANLLFTALLSSGREALEAEDLGAAESACGEAVAIRPNDALAAQCLANAVPVPTSSIASTAARVPPAPDASGPSPIAAPTATVVPTSPPTAAPTYTPVPALGAATQLGPGSTACPDPTASFDAASVSFDTPTTLMVAGLAPDALLTVVVADAPAGYRAAARQVRAGASCQREIPMVFRAAEHHPGVWTFLVKGTSAEGSEVELAASVIVTP
jgi:hypothetical protein